MSVSTHRPLDNRHLACHQGVRYSPAPIRGGRLVVAHLEHAPGRLDLRPCAPPGDKGAGERGIREIDRNRVIQNPRVPEAVMAQPSAPQFSSSQAVM